jgi:hypothetical protein
MTLQGLIVVLLSAVAAVFLAWRVLGPFLVKGAGSTGCHGCSGCDQNAGMKQKSCPEDGLVQPLSSASVEPRDLAVPSPTPLVFVRRSAPRTRTE